MLLYDCFSTLPVNLQVVGILPSDVKCTSRIVCCKCISIMADSDKTLHGDSIRSSAERNPLLSTIIPTASGILHPDSQIHQNALPAGEFLAHKKKPTSFQITSVTVQGSRSNDGGDDSADDLDESHTEDVSSDILDCSRTTDIDNDQLSEDNSNANNDDLPTPSGPSIPVKSVESDSTSVTISVDVPLNVTVSVSTAPLNDVESNVTSSADSSNTSTVVSTNEPIMNPLPDQWQHRFKVVKIVSSEPFKRGRWLCMDFMDPPTVQSAEVKQEILDSTGGTGTVLTNVDSTAGSVLSDNPPVNRLAHIYEIPPNQSYPGSISVTVGPHQVQQPLYGIILPMNNGQTPQITMVQTVGIQTSQPEPSQTQESIATPQTSQQQTPANFVAQVSQQQPTFSGQPTTYGGQAVQQQNFTSQPQQHQGIPPATVQSQQLPVQQPQVIPVSVQHQPQITGGSTATAQVISAAVSQQVTAPIVSQQQVVQDPHITAHQHSQATQQQNKGLQVHQTPIQLSQQSHPSGQVTSVVSSPPLSQLPQVATNVPQTQPSQLHQASGMPGNQPPSVTSQVSVASNIPESSLVTSNQSVINQDVFNVPSQVPVNNPETSGQRMPSTVNPQALLEVLPETLNSKNVVNGEESESASGGTSTVAIDNKIEQAMDLVKSHLMFAVREEVDVLKEKITELMDRISQLEYENGFLRANASQETLNQLTQAQQLQQQQQQQPQTTTITSTPLQQQQQLQQQPQIVNLSQQQNIQKQQPAS